MTPEADARMQRARELLEEQGCFDNGPTEWVHLAAALRAIAAALSEQTDQPRLCRHDAARLSLLQKRVADRQPLDDADLTRPFIEKWRAEEDEEILALIGKAPGA